MRARGRGVGPAHPARQRCGRWAPHGTRGCHHTSSPCQACCPLTAFSFPANPAFLYNLFFRCFFSVSCLFNLYFTYAALHYGFTCWRRKVRRAGLWGCISLKHTQEPLGWKTGITGSRAGPCGVKQCPGKVIGAASPPPPNRPASPASCLPWPDSICGCISFNTHPTKISCVGICVAFFSGKKIDLQGAALHPHRFSYARRAQPRRDRTGRQLRWLHGRIIYKHEPLQNSTPRKKHRSLAISIAIL